MDRWPRIAKTKWRRAPASRKWWKRARKPSAWERTEGQSQPLEQIMAISVVMPALEMAQKNGKLLAWRKKEGERVQKGEPLLEIETDKAVVEVESPADGSLDGVTAQVG